ncbi:MAG: PilZ domain-containing protein [Gammaproteobacteria bacterium]|jgi:c-di-GMP-binding flagellar brake protein YcgR|nr:PilZ domain-containing protein [Gammaproteobacteria bacterium]
MVSPRPKQTSDASGVCVSDPERRDLQRVPIECNALLRLAEYLTFRVRLRNISADAVQVICDPRYALLIHSGGADSPPDESRLIDISIALPEDKGAGDFQARCRVKYCVEYDADRMLLGLQFVSIGFRSVQQLDRFIESRVFALGS